MAFSSNSTTYLSFNDFLADVSIKYEHLFRAGNIDIKYGQLYIDLLYAFKPDLADELRSSSFNPVLLDNIHPDTHNFVESKW